MQAPLCEGSDYFYVEVDCVWVESVVWVWRVKVVKVCWVVDGVWNVFEL